MPLVAELTQYLNLVLAVFKGTGGTPHVADLIIRVMKQAIFAPSCAAEELDDVGIQSQGDW
jgi:hypothetical protein